MYSYSNLHLQNYVLIYCFDVGGSNLGGSTETPKPPRSAPGKDEIVYGR